MSELAILVDIQLAHDIESDLRRDLPSADVIEKCIDTAYVHLSTLPNHSTTNNSNTLRQELPRELSIRIVSVNESQMLNAQYRQKDKPTNVLSFESDLPDFIPSGFIGDLVICAQVVKDEAVQQNKQLSNHWAHMCVHGMLHLLGYDHISESDATLMETLEVEILAKLGIDDPYQLS